MSDNEDDYDDEGNLITKPDPGGPKALRDELRKVKKERDDLLAENEKFKKDQRASSIEQALEKHGAPVKLKRLVAADVEDPSDDAVLKWLEENGSDFGWEPPGDSDDAVDVDTREQAGRIGRAAAAAPPPKDRAVNPEFLRTASTEELIRLGHINA